LHPDPRWRQAVFRFYFVPSFLQIPSRHLDLTLIIADVPVFYYPLTFVTEMAILQDLAFAVFCWTSPWLFIFRDRVPARFSVKWMTLLFEIWSPDSPELNVCTAFCLC